MRTWRRKLQILDYQGSSVEHILISQKILQAQSKCSPTVRSICFFFFSNKLNSVCFTLIVCITFVMSCSMYMPPEYLNKRIITKKYDVFSLGVIIIQIMTGRDGFSEYWEMTSSEYRVQQFIELVRKVTSLRQEH